MIQMLLLIPIILSTAVVGFAGAMTIHITEKTNFICRQGLLHSEMDLIKKLNDLVALNPTAEILRAANTASKLSLMIPIYGEISEASVQTARAVFHTLQIGLIQSANLEIKSNLLKAKLQIENTSDFGIRNLVKAQILNSPRLAVDAKPKTSLTPDYLPKLNFEELSTSRIQWSIALERMLPRWLSDYLESKNFQSRSLDFTLSCAGSAARNKGDKWQAALSDKTSLQYTAIRAKQLLSLF